MKTIFLSSLTAVTLLGLVLSSSTSDLADGSQMVDALPVLNQPEEEDETAALMMCEVFSSQEDPSCPGFSDGMISVFVAGVVHPVTYDWEQDQYDGDSVLMNLSASSYTVTVTDAIGCMTSNSFSLFDPAALNLTGCTNTTDATGAANADGAVTVNVSGGTPPYDLDLAGPTPSSLTNQSFGAKTFSNLLPGDYVLTLTDDNGCELLCNITIAFAGCTLAVNGTGTDPSCFGFSDGSIELTVTGATGTPSFNWSDGSIGNVEDPSDLGPGTYSVTVTDEAACEAMTTVMLNNPDPLNIICTENAPASDDVTPDGSATITPSGGNGPYLLSWSGAASGSQGGVTGATTINGLVHGDYTLTLTDANSCTETCLFTITSNSLPLQVECPDVADGDGDPSIYTYSTGPFTCGVDLTIPTPVVINGCTSHSTVAELFASNNMLVYSGTFGDIITQVEAGQYYYRYTITDSCGEMVSVDCPVQVLDTVDPTATCHGAPIVIELDNSGMATYLASQLDAGSTDNCEIASVEIRREILFDAQCDPVASSFSNWGPSISFDACDLNNPNILLQLMVTDTAGNTETCFTNNVTVVDLVNDCDRQSDSLALVNLYEETGGSSWNFSQTQYISGPSGFSPIPNAGQAWIFTEPMSTWHGVELSPEGCVQKLILNEVGMIDSLPDLQLPNLLEFYCYGNSLAGAIPDFTNLLNLDVLSTWDNQLTDTIPDFSNLSTLTVLVVSENQLTGTLPDFNNLPNLEYLICTNNQLSGNISDFAAIPNLLILDGGSNNFTGSLPDFTNLPLLVSMQLYNNQLTETIPDFTNLPNLTSVNLWENELEGLFPNLSDNCPLLRRFYYDDNRFTFEDILPYLNANQQLIASNATFNPDSLRYALQDSVYVDTLIQVPVGDNLSVDLVFDDTVTTNIYYWYKDGVLWNTVNGQNSLDFTNIQLTDAGTYNVQVENPNAPLLTLYGRTITIEVSPCVHPDYLPLMAVYNSTDGPNWAFSGTNADPSSTTFGWGKDCDPCNWYGVLCSGDRVRILDLDGNAGWDPVGNGGNNLTGTIPPEISQLTELTTIYFGGNNLTDVIPTEIGLLANLEILDLADNQLTGPLPASLGDLANLLVLSLTLNNINGSIPPELGQLTQLERLFLRINQLSGEIPGELGNLTNLIQLRLDGNNLSGCFHPNLANLCYMVEQNLDVEFWNNFDLAWDGNFPLFCNMQTQVIDETICAGETYFIGTTPYTEAGLHSETILSVEGCDSLVMVDLAVLPVAESFLVDSYCTGDGTSLQINGTIYDEGNPLGMEILANAAANGCDSIVNIDLSFLTFSEVDEAITLCPGEELMINDFVLNADNPVYEDTLVGANFNGCDSIINYSLSFYETMGALDTILCDGEIFNYFGVEFNTGNLSAEVTPGAALQTDNGCDSTVLVTVSFYPPAAFNYQEVLCETDTVQVGTSQFFLGQETGQVILPAAASTGCDSIVNVDLEFLTSVSSSETIPLCEGEAFEYDGETYFAPDVIENTLTSLNGCDSLVTITLEAYPTYQIQLDSTICAGESVTIGGNSFTTTGTFDVPLQTAIQGCDSLIQLDLTVLEPVEATFETTLCGGGEVSINGELFNEGNPSSVQTLTSSAGCDSLLTVTVTFDPVLEGQLETTLCAGGEVSINGELFNEDNPTSVQTLTTPEGCDSLLTVTVNFEPLLEGQLDTLLCAGETVQIGGQTIGTPLVDELIFLPNGAVNGCDSSVLANVAFYPLDESTTEATICAGESFTFFGVALSEAGQYPGTATNVQGCDSTVILTLNVLPADDITINETICEGDSYNFFGVGLTEPGEYTGMGTNLSNCDSIVTLNLSVLPAVTNTLDETICNGESYLFFGQELTEPGTYMETGMSTIGCDSTVTLNLSFGVADTTYINASICEGESYFLCDELYTEAGMYECYLNTSGCDSLIILDLSIEPPAMLFAEQDAYEFTRSNEPVTLPVTDNDVIEGAFALELVNSPQGGTLTIEEEDILFLSDGQYTGQDSFLYALCPTVCPGICDTAMVFLNIEFDCLSEIISNAATAFSPNGDGLNDLFDPLASVSEAGECVNSDQVSFTIINRNGEIVLQTDSYLPWDGTDVRGAEVPDATYFYILEFEDEVVKRPVVVVR